MFGMAGQMTLIGYDEGGASLLEYSVLLARKNVSPHDLQFPYPYSLFSLNAEKIQSGMNMIQWKSDAFTCYYTIDILGQ